MYLTSHEKESMNVATPKERPILFNGEMVRAILEGRKTQTRRVVKPHPDLHERKHRWAFVIDQGELKYGKAPWRKSDPHNFYVENGIKCPFGKPGDRLWVRETFSETDCACSGDPLYRNQCIYCKGKGYGLAYRADVGKSEYYPFKWRPSIHMPRWASRITLEITDVRVERLNDISEEDAKAEGVFGYSSESGTSGWGEDDPSGKVQVPYVYKRKWAFKHLWNSVYGTWKENPFVWAITFKRLT
jgi:hypothetical protein